MSTEFYLWIEYQPYEDDSETGWRGGRRRASNNRDAVQPMNGKVVEEAQKEAIDYLDGSYKDSIVKTAVLMRFERNIISVYDKDRYKRQGEKEDAKKRQEIAEHEKRIAELKKELGEGQ